MLNRQSAADYIRQYHAQFGGARVAWAIESHIDGLPTVMVKFWHDGSAAIAHVWVEFGKLYGEW